jgi:hypothetical protein
VTDLDSSGPIAGYYDSPFPGEDGGPRRQLTPRSPGLGLRAGERLAANHRPAMLSNMVVLRNRGEVFLQGSSAPGPQTTGWVERIDPVTLEPLARSPDLAAGPFWPGGILVHQNGDLYMTYGRYCHRLDEGCNVVAARELPRDRPYNSLLALSDGCLVMKSFVRDGSERSYFSVLEPERLQPTGPEVEVPEGSIARISRDITPHGEFVYVLGDHTAFRYRYDDGRVRRDESWEYRYRTRPDHQQSFAWDPVIAARNCWFPDNGMNAYQRELRGTGVASSPLSVHRVSLTDAADHDVFQPFPDAPHGTVVNPPAFDSARNILVAFDSGNARIAAFHYVDGRYKRLWEHPYNTGSHFLLFPDTGELVINDFDGTTDHAVVLQIDTGAELARVSTGSAMMSVVFPSPGWSRDFYTTSFSGITRISVG